MERLLEIVAALRKRCPWDRQQTRETLKPYIIEEAYELVEAIEEKDPEKIKEELGDLLFQIVLQARVASERGEFDMEGVMGSIARKMVHRHPHVFGKTRVKGAGEVIARWQELKRKEGKFKGGLLSGIPACLPALMRAEKVQKRAARAGFDWKDARGTIEKLDEEIGEFKKAVRGKKKRDIEEELGDILFSLVNVSRFYKARPEEALRKTTSRFMKRFAYMEKKAGGQGLCLQEMTLPQLDELWEEAKKKMMRG